MLDNWEVSLIWIHEGCIFDLPYVRSQIVPLQTIAGKPPASTLQPAFGTIIGYTGLNKSASKIAIEDLGGIEAYWRRVFYVTPDDIELFRRQVDVAIPIGAIQPEDVRLKRNPRDRNDTTKPGESVVLDLASVAASQYQT